jgi:integrase
VFECVPKTTYFVPKFVPKKGQWMKRRITEKHLEARPVNPRGDEIWDLTVEGFGYRKTKPDKAGFFIRWRDDEGKNRRKSIGKYPRLSLADARKRARKALKEARAGGDPEAILNPPPKPNTAIAPIVDRYLAEHAAKKHKHPQWTNSYFQRFVLPRIGHREIESLTLDDWLAVIDTPDTVSVQRALFAHCSGLLKWVRKKNDLPTIPNVLTGLSLFDEAPKRKRVFSDDEMARILKACRTMGGPYGACFEILARTCLRLREVADLMWSEIDFDYVRRDERGKEMHREAIIQLGPERNKGKQHEVVPITPAVEEILKAQPHTSEFIFPGPDGDKPLNSFSLWPRKLWVLADVENAVVHDLRRTGRSNLSRLSVKPHIAERCLFHKQGKVADIYDRWEYLDERRDALLRLEALLDGLIGEGAKIVPFHHA